MASYYRNLCPNFSLVICPLTNLLKKSAKFEWTPHCQKAFENVKLLLTAAPVFAAPHSGLPFEIKVDASQVGAGAVLLQTHFGGVSHPVSFLIHIN